MNGALWSFCFFGELSLEVQMAYALPVVALSASNVDVTGPASASFDGFTAKAGDRVLLTKQTKKSENGVWLWAGGSPPSPLKRPGGDDQYKTGNVLDNATLIWVTNGDAYGGSVWGVDPADVIKVDATGHTLSRVALPPVQARAATPGGDLALSSATRTSTVCRSTKATSFS
jgi:hypothetical protein